MRTVILPIVLPAILAEPHSELAGIVTRDPAKAAPYGVPAWTDLDRALAECPAELVYVATPVALHALPWQPGKLGGNDHDPLQARIEAFKRK